MSLYYLILWNQVDILQKHFKKDHIHMRLWTRFYDMTTSNIQHLNMACMHSLIYLVAVWMCSPSKAAKISFDMHLMSISPPSECKACWILYSTMYSNISNCTPHPFTTHCKILIKTILSALKINLFWKQDSHTIHIHFIYASVPIKLVTCNTEHKMSCRKWLTNIISMRVTIHPVCPRSRWNNDPSFLGAPGVSHTLPRRPPWWLRWRQRSGRWRVYGRWWWTFGPSLRCRAPPGQSFRSLCRGPRWLHLGGGCVDSWPGLWRWLLSASDPRTAGLLSLLPTCRSPGRRVPKNVTMWSLISWPDLIICHEEYILARHIMIWEKKIVSVTRNFMYKTYRRVPGRTMWTQCLALPGTHHSSRRMRLSLDTYFNPPPIYHLYVLFLEFFIPS